LIEAFQGLRAINVFWHITIDVNAKRDGFYRPSTQKMHGENEDM
jgi:hypothetical protein